MQYVRLSLLVSVGKDGTIKLPYGPGMYLKPPGERKNVPRYVSFLKARIPDGKGGRKHRTLQTPTTEDGMEMVTSHHI